MGNLLGRPDEVESSASTFGGSRFVQLSYGRMCRWCPPQASNLHALRHETLDLARLPISPGGRMKVVVPENFEISTVGL